MNPRVSFVIPCYNEREYVRGCLASIAGQLADPESYEVIVVDNGSRDGTREAASALGARVLLNERRGAAASRNLGAGAARGELLAFVDADCLLPPRWLPALSAHVLEGAAAAAAPAVPVEEGITWVEQAWADVFVCMARRSPGGVHTVSNLASSNLLMAKSLFNDAGGFDEALLSCEDYDLSQRLLKKGRLVLDESIAVLHLRESKTLGELFRREVARGRFSLRCFVKNGCRIRELMSTAIPTVNLLFSLVLLWSLLWQKPPVALFCLLWLLGVPALYLARSGRLPGSLLSALQYYLVAADYVAARTMALLKELCDIGSGGRNAAAPDIVSGSPGSG